MLRYVARGLERGDRESRVRLRDDRQDARCAHPHEAPPARPRAGSRLRLRARRRLAGEAADGAPARGPPLVSRSVSDVRTRPRRRARGRATRSAPPQPCRHLFTSCQDIPQPVATETRRPTSGKASASTRSSSSAGSPRAAPRRRRSCSPASYPGTRSPASKRDEGAEPAWSARRGSSRGWREARERARRARRRRERTRLRRRGGFDGRVHGLPAPGRRGARRRDRRRLRPAPPTPA